MEEVLQRASRGECVLWIRNTVDDAQQTYRKLRSSNVEGGPSIALLHSRFPFFRREQLETEWMSRLGRGSISRPNGCVLVSTQVAEQSVDLDSDLLITDLAPTDMLLQRLGRLWRHERGPRPCSAPEVWVQEPELDDRALHDADVKKLREAFGKSARVYAPYVLLRSLQQWRNRSTLTLPDEIRPILESTYAIKAIDEPSAWDELREELEKQKARMAMMALSATTVWQNPPLDDEEGVQTRWNMRPMAQLVLATQTRVLNSHAARVLLLDGTEIDPNDRYWSFDAAKAIHRNLVRVPLWAVAETPETPRWLSNYVPFSAALGLVRPGGEIVWPSQNESTGLSYDPDQGVVIARHALKPPQVKELDESYD
jgi:CRISPR-associated endonuclease/helicase Cas3